MLTKSLSASEKWWWWDRYVWQARMGPVGLVLPLTMKMGPQELWEAVRGHRGPCKPRRCSSPTDQRGRWAVKHRIMRSNQIPAAGLLALLSSPDKWDKHQGLAPSGKLLALNMAVMLGIPARASCDQWGKVRAQQVDCKPSILEHWHQKLPRSRHLAKRAKSNMISSRSSHWSFLYLQWKHNRHQQRVLGLRLSQHSEILSSKIKKNIRYLLHPVALKLIRRQSPIWNWEDIQIKTHSHSGGALI